MLDIWIKNLDLLQEGVSVFLILPSPDGFSALSWQIFFGKVNDVLEEKKNV